MPICVVPNCTNKAVKGETSLFRFPQETLVAFNLWKRWVRSIRKDPVQITKATRICSDHFKIGDTNYREAEQRYRLNPELAFRVKLAEGAVPCLSPGVPLRKQMEDQLQNLVITIKQREVEAESELDEDEEEDSDDEEVVFIEQDEEDMTDSIPGDNDDNIQFDDMNKLKDPLTCPKLIVSVDRIYELLKYCRYCNLEKNEVEHIKTRSVGCAVFESRCSTCGFAYQWTNTHRGLNGFEWNVLLSAAILYAGCLPYQICRMFTAMHVLFSVPATFFNHQKKTLLPVINTQYKEEQQRLVSGINGAINIAGDARCDSMGSSAHYSLYSMAEINLRKIIDIQLVTRPEVENKSPNMEFCGLKRALGALEEMGLKIKSVITDQHRSIIPYFRDMRKDITHYHDCWHVVKGVMKALKKLSQRKEREEVALRLQPIKNRLYKIAQLVPPSENRQLIMEDYISGMERHLNGEHDHPELLHYPKCEHEEYNEQNPPSIPLSKACPDGYDEVKDVLKNKQRRACIKRMSPHGQTSMNEAFNSAVLWYTPKHVHFKFPAMLGRSQLAVLHYNENSNRTKIGQRVIYRKYGAGKGCVKDVVVNPTYNYVSNLMERTLKVLRGDATVNQPPAPPSMTASLPNKENPEDVLTAYQTRFTFQ